MQTAKQIDSPAQHTPGPWITRGNGKVCAASATILIADCIPQNLNFMAKGPDANARLIAAAPDMKAELLGYEELLEQWEGAFINDDQLIVRLRTLYTKRAAITKATEAI